MSIGNTNKINENFSILHKVKSGRIQIKCRDCGRNYEVNKETIESDMFICKCRELNQEYNGKAFTNREGQTFSNILILKELGNGRIKGECLLCGTVKDFDRFAVIHKSVISCGCLDGIDLVGMQINGLEITKLIGKNYVEAKCIHCGKEEAYNKKRILSSSTRTCKCQRYHNRRLKGKIFKSLKVITDKENGFVSTKCIVCGDKGEYRKAILEKGNFLCKKCGSNQIYDGNKKSTLEIKRDLGFGRVKAQCSVCNTIREYRRYDIEQGRVERCSCCKVEIKKD